ncbi:hypothetical protein EJB05_38295 [Eragrostis curvula]|uniref:Uncharacterized protein n=1 Tax=Eragrostis curvula TaxID=38414 RepID=A0A5J9TTU6_9POAL|nr:hypothetical protein EJB05_38252 [Eragrostis curvula]TVU14802.1 hypothetical protein EJB05_38295 [Eragrostis curvula]
MSLVATQAPPVKIPRTPENPSATVSNAHGVVASPPPVSSSSAPVLTINLTVSSKASFGRLGLATARGPDHCLLDLTPGGCVRTGCDVMPASGSGVWSRRRDEITFDRLHKFWEDLPPHARQELLKLDKSTLIEDARKNSYCSRCNGLLLDCFSQIALYGKSLQQEASDIDLSRQTAESRVKQVEQDEAQNPSVHPWGGLSTTKDDILTLVNCFIKAKSLDVLQNVFDNALVRERDRKMCYPDACGAGGRGYGTREMCALHTARPSCDALVDFWSALSEETRSSLLRMREEDFIEKLTCRFNKKKFCRDCRRNVTREFKELKELKRMRRERRCNCWFCVDNGFQCEVFEDGIIVDWRQCLSEAEGPFDHFEWAVGTNEGESDILDFEDVGMNARVHRTGINLVEFENYFITLRAWRSDGRCTQYCVKAHVLKGKSCVHLHHTLVVSAGFVTITDVESMQSFFERAEKAEEEDEDVAMNRDGNDLDGDGSHAQKHAKSPELAREFLLDSAAVIFKEKVVKAFRDSTVKENAKSVFVSLALKLLEERVHVACKELIILEKQNKLLEEEEKEMCEKQERKMKRRSKEKEKKHRQKQRLKEKGKDTGAKLFESKSPALSDSSPSTNHESTNCTPDSRDSAKAKVVDLHSPGRFIDQSSCRENKVEHSNGVTELSPMDCSDCCSTSEQSESSKRSPRLWKDSPQDQPCWCDGSEDEPGRIGDSQWQLIERKRSSARSCSLTVSKGSRISSAQKIAILKQVWEPVYARKKTGLYSTDNAWGSVGNVNPLKPVDCDATGCQKLRAGCDEPLHLASENSSNLYISGTHQACGNSQSCQAASSDGTHMVNKQDCYSTPDESFWHDEDLMRKYDSYSSLSSCMGEGDRESSCSSSSVTISSEQNPESSLSDETEGSPYRIESNLDTLPLRTASQSLLEACAWKGFRECRPETTGPTHSDRFGFNAPIQYQQFHHQSMHVPSNSPATLRLHNHYCWASPTNRNFQYVNHRVQYRNVNPYLAHQQCCMHPEPIQKAAASFRAVPPSPPCQDGDKQIVGHPHRKINAERHPSNKLKRLGQKDHQEDNGKTQDDADASFSLFQFSLPIASPVPASFEDDRCGEFSDRTPLAQVCSREQTGVKEYKLFSTKDSGMFSFICR